MGKHEIAELLALIEDHKVQFSSDPFELEKTKRQLDRVEFRVSSDCGRVSVEMSAGSGMRRLAIEPGTKTHLDHVALARLITETVRRAEELQSRAVTESATRQLRRRDR